MLDNLAPIVPPKGTARGRALGSGARLTLAWTPHKTFSPQLDGPRVARRRCLRGGEVSSRSEQGDAWIYLSNPVVIFFSRAASR